MKLEEKDQFTKQLHLLHTQLAIILKFYQNLEILSEQFNFYKKIRAFPIIDHNCLRSWRNL